MDNSISYERYRRQMILKDAWDATKKGVGEAGEAVGHAGNFFDKTGQAISRIQFFLSSMLPDGIS